MACSAWKRVGALVPSRVHSRESIWISLAISSYAAGVHTALDRHIFVRMDGYNGKKTAYNHLVHYSHIVESFFVRLRLVDPMAGRLCRGPALAWATTSVQQPLALAMRLAATGAGALLPCTSSRRQCYSVDAYKGVEELNKVCMTGLDREYTRGISCITHFQRYARKVVFFPALEHVPGAGRAARHWHAWGGR